MANNNITTEDNAKIASGFKIEKNILIGEELILLDEPLNAGEVILNILKSNPEFIGRVEAMTGKQSTYGEMSEQSVKCAVWFKKEGIQPGDVISLCTDNYLNSYVPFLAALYVGAICASGNHEMTAYSARHYLSMVKPKIIFVDIHCMKFVRDAAKELNMNIRIVTIEDESYGQETLNEILAKQTSSEVENYRCAKIQDPVQTALIVCSSGTTGPPKGVESTHLALRTLLHPSNVDDRKNRVSLWSSSLRWMYGIIKTLKSLRALATNIVAPDNGDIELYCQIIDKYKVEFFVTEPTMILELVKFRLLEKYRLTSLKVITLSGSRFKAEQQEEISKLLPQASILQVYGTTDAGNVCIKQTKDNHLGSCGFVAKGIQLKIVDTTTGEGLGSNKKGEICIKSATVMKGYFNNPEATKQALDSDGWLHTGDIGYYIENGEVFVVDRISDFINFRGVGISASEIEVVLEKHPAVFKAAVIPLESEFDVEVPLAVVSKLPNKEVEERELIQFVDQHLPDLYSIRGGVKFMESLPRTPTGKIAKNELKKMFCSPKK